MTPDQLCKNCKHPKGIHTGHTCFGIIGEGHTCHCFKFEPKSSQSSVHPKNSDTRGTQFNGRKLGEETVNSASMEQSSIPIKAMHQTLESSNLSADDAFSPVNEVLKGCSEKYEVDFGNGFFQCGKHRCNEHNCNFEECLNKEYCSSCKSFAKGIAKTLNESLNQLVLYSNN